MPAQLDRTIPMQSLTLIHSDSFPIGLYAGALSRESIAARSVGNLANLGAGNGALRVVLIDSAVCRDAPGGLDARTAVVGVGLAEQPSWLADDSIYLHLPENPSTPVLVNAVKRGYQFLYQKMRGDQLERQLAGR